VTHGLQFVDPQLHNIPTAYFGPQSGVGVMFRNVPRPAPLRVGVVGLGIGTVAAYAQPGDVFRFYEINPNVLPLAVTYFDFLNRSPARIEHIDGDARLSMQQEPQQNYDVFILDAFSGDAIPVHLLTRECFELYLHHLREGGIIAVHISNQHLNLAPVVRKLADHFGLASALIVNSTPAPGQYVSRWMLLSRNERWIGSPAIQQRATPLPSDQSGLRLWTDDDTNLFQILN
jgi:spermidine synthase